MFLLRYHKACVKVLEKHPVGVYYTTNSVSFTRKGTYQHFLYLHIS